MKTYVGFDVSLDETSIGIVGEDGKVLAERKLPSTPDAIAAVIPATLKTAPRFTDMREACQGSPDDTVLLARGAKNEIDDLNYEMRRAKLVGWSDAPYHEGHFLDTQVISWAKFPGAPASLDALCDRLWVDRSDRFTQHGALLDAELTAEAFIKMTAGFIRDEVRTFNV